jgi:hypothetical protein
MTQPATSCHRAPGVLASWAWQRATLIRAVSVCEMHPHLITTALIMRLAVNHHPDGQPPLCAPGPCLSVLTAARLLATMVVQLADEGERRRG